MYQLTKYLVCTQLGVHHSGSNKPFGIDKDTARNLLQRERNVYVFDTAEQAQIFVQTVSERPSTSTFLNFFRNTVDYPIFTVEANEFPTHNKLREFKSPPITGLMPITLFNDSGSYTKEVSGSLDLNVSDGLKDLLTEQITAVNSAWGYQYSFDYVPEATCSIS